jgi:hypothetical protein
VPFRFYKLVFALALMTASLSGQESAPPASKPSDKPQVRVNYLNVCSPSAADQQELEAALSRISPKPVFAVDMEISRGRSTLNPSDLIVNTGQPTQQTNAISKWVRIRRDFPDSSPLTSAQYSFSVTEKNVAETFVAHFRDNKNVLQVSISDSVDGQEPNVVANNVTPADRIRIERFGKSSIVLARCANSDQLALEPLFGHATMLMNAYRRAFDTESTIPAEFAKLSRGVSRPKKSVPAASKPH